MLSWLATFLRSCLTLALRFWNQFWRGLAGCCCGCAGPARDCSWTATHVDLVQRHAQSRGKVLLDERAGLVLHLEVLLEDIVLLLGQAWLDVAGGRFLGRWVRVRVRGPACFLRRSGRVHGRQQQQAANSSTLSSRLVSHGRRRWRQRSDAQFEGSALGSSKIIVMRRARDSGRRRRLRARWDGMGAARGLRLYGGMPGHVEIRRSSSRVGAEASDGREEQQERK
jgi:hypothetical protein